MAIVTLTQALESAATAVYLDRQKANSQFGVGLFDRAVTHFQRIGLRADTDKGETKDNNRVRSRFVSYDWSETYDEAPHFVWYDFFRGHVFNAVSRMARGLDPW